MSSKRTSKPLRWRIGASELATVAGLHKYNPFGSLKWMQSYSKVHIRSFGLNDLLQKLGVVIDQMTEAPSAPSSLLADEEHLKNEVKRLREEVAEKGVEVLHHQEEADARAVGIVTEEQDVKAGRLKGNNARSYGSNYLNVNLFAYIDGDIVEEGDVLVEKKTRQNRLFAEIPLYELIQLSVILFCRYGGLPEESAAIELRQSYKGKEKTHVFTWSKLKETLEETMAAFSELMNELRLKKVLRALDEEESTAFLDWIAEQDRST